MAVGGSRAEEEIMRRALRLAGLLAVAALCAVPSPLRAEGNVFYGGFGIDQPNCGIALLPCGTLFYATARACTLSFQTQETYHVFHVYDGYINTCDRVGGSGREQQGWIERNWGGLLQSVLIP